MRLFIAICFDDNMLDSLAEIQDDLRRCGTVYELDPEIGKRNRRDNEKI